MAQTAAPRAVATMQGRGKYTRGREAETGTTGMEARGRMETRQTKGRLLLRTEGAQLLSSSTEGRRTSTTRGGAARSELADKERSADAALQKGWKASRTTTAGGAWVGTQSRTRTAASVGAAPRHWRSTTT